MALPICELITTVEVPESVGEDTGYNYDINTFALYSVMGTIINYSGTEVEVFKPGELIPLTTTVSGIFTDLHITLPELRQYVLRFVGSTEISTISVTPDNLADFIDTELFNRAIAGSRHVPAVATKYGYPVLDIEYTGPSLTEYASNRFSNSDMVPWYVGSAAAPIDVLIPSTYLIAENQPLLMSYSQEVLLSPNGEVFTIHDGYSYASYLSTPGSVKFSSIYLSLKKSSTVGAGIQLNIYAGSSLVISPTVLATAVVSQANIPDAAGLVEFKLDNELTINGFWVQIIPLNQNSEYEITLASESFCSAMKVSRYTRLFDAGVDQGLLYTNVLQVLLDTIYAISVYPVLVTKAEDLVQLNRLFQTKFGYTTGFDGPCIVCYKELSLLQISDQGISYGPDNNKTIENIAISINNVENYNSFIVLSGNISKNSLYTEYYEPYLNVASPTASIQLRFNGVISPDGNKRTVTLRSANLMTRYEEPRSVLLKTPFIDTGGEWRPVVTGGLMYRPDFNIGDSIFVNGFGIDTISAISDTQIQLTAIGAVAAPLLYKVDEPSNYRIIIQSERPIQIAKDTFQLSHSPLYIDGFNNPAITFKVGDRYENDITNDIVDWDINSSVITLNRDIRFDINKHIKYKYIEYGDVINTINLKASLDDKVNIYVSSTGNIVTADHGGVQWFVETSVLYLLIGTYGLSNLVSPSNIDIRDIRQKGGGLIKDISFKDAFTQNVGIVGFYDIGFNDGMNIPQMVLNVALPSDISSKFDSYEVDSILHTHANVGTKIYVEYPANLYTITGTGNTIGLEDGTGDILLEDSSGTILTEE